MNNYTTQIHNLKRGIFSFSKKICSGLKLPETKFVSQMMYGMLSGQSCHLSEIARNLNEKTTLKKVIDRLSVNLRIFSDDEKTLLTSNYLKTVKSQLKDNSILIIDGSDIVKPSAQKMESLCRVHDGSNGCYGDGYWTIGISAIMSGNKLPLPVYSRIYSSTEKDFISSERETLNALRFMSENFSKKNVRTFDRGYDSKGERINILKLASKFKGKYKLDFKKQNGKKTSCKISTICISLPCKPDVELNLVICHGFGIIPMMLISSMDDKDKNLALVITKVYLLRWRIEEYYKFKKQQFGFEDLRVRSLSSIRALDLLLTIAIGYISLIASKGENRIMKIELVEISKRVNKKTQFLLYAIADGIFNILRSTRSGIAYFFVKDNKPLQLSMFRWVALNVA